jgi:N-acetylmuramoyl-L-alanine amidase
MPAVLVELGFMTNAEQERQLTSDAYQASVVEALVEAVVRFRDRGAPVAPRGAPTGGGQP